MPNPALIQYSNDGRSGPADGGRSIDRLLGNSRNIENFWARHQSNPLLTSAPYLSVLWVRRHPILVKITSKRQVTFPKHVLDALGVGPGDRLELLEGPEGYTLKPRRIDHSRLGTLREKIDPNIEPLDIRKFRDEGYDPDKYRD